jgi:hypothetical protein
MSRFILKIFVFLFAITLWQVGSFAFLTSGFDGQVSIAEASHRGGGDQGGGRGGGNCKGRRCQPPTVSELPIQYMVLSGVAMIALSGGAIFYIRKRRMKNSLEA